MTKIALIKLSVLSLCTFLLSPDSFAETNRTEIVYGDDNRLESYESSHMQQRLAKSTAGMISNVKMIDIGNHYLLPPKTLDMRRNLCPGEIFSEQSNAVSCSGFLVGPDLLVTAGHCIQTEQECKETSWIFDYKVVRKTKRDLVAHPKENIFKCSKVLDAELGKVSSGIRDFSLIKLDRVVTGRAALKFRNSGKINDNQKLFVIGHPSGLPTKVTTDGIVEENRTIHHFESNLDTFGGNSGSAVFHETTGLVEGILVRGAKDYIYDRLNKCNRVNRVAARVGTNPNLGESVSRITDIPSLKHRDALMLAVKKNDLVKAQKLIKKVKAKSIYDNQMNTALHHGVLQKNRDMIKMLIKESVDVNSQNIDGDTALHIAIANKSYKIAGRLLLSGAKIGIKNNKGVSAMSLTGLISSRIRSLM